MLESDLFFVQINGIAEGPLSRSDVERLHGANLITRHSLCRKATSQQWLTVWDLVPSAMHADETAGEIPKLRYQRAGASSSLYLSADRHDLRKGIGIFVGIIAVLVIGWALTVVFWDSSPKDYSKNRATSLSSGAGRSVPGGGLTSDERTLAQLTASQNKFVSQLNAMVAGSIAFAFFGILLSFVFLGFWLWMIIAVATLEPPTHDKTTWTIIVVFLGPLGATIYFFARYIRLSKI